MCLRSSHHLFLLRGFVWLFFALLCVVIDVHLLKRKLILNLSPFYQSALSDRVDCHIQIVCVLQKRNFFLGDSFLREKSLLLCDWRLVFLSNVFFNCSNKKIITPKINSDEIPWNFIGCSMKRRHWFFSVKKLCTSWNSSTQEAHDQKTITTRRIAIKHGDCFSSGWKQSDVIQLRNSYESSTTHSKTRLRLLSLSHRQVNKNGCFSFAFEMLDFQLMAHFFQTVW